MRLLPVWALPVSAVLLKVFRGAWTHWLCFRVKVTGPRISQGRPASSLLGLRTPKSAAPGIRGPRGFLGGERPPGASVSAPFPFLLPESFSRPRRRPVARHPPRPGDLRPPHGAPSPSAPGRAHARIDGRRVSVAFPRVALVFLFLPPPFFTFWVFGFTPFIIFFGAGPGVYDIYVNRIQVRLHHTASRLAEVSERYFLF